MSFFARARAVIERWFTIVLLRRGSDIERERERGRKNGAEVVGGTKEISVARSVAAGIYRAMKSLAAVVIVC